MTIFKFGSKAKAKSGQQPVVPIAPTSGTVQASSPQPAVPVNVTVQQPRSKTLSQLEAELEAQRLSTRPHTPSPVSKPKQGFFNKLLLLALLLGVPVGIVALANLPVPGWRNQVAKNVPILLFPTYSTWDRAHKDAADNLNQADQLINRPTSAADLDLGGKKLAIAKEALNKLPTEFLDEDFTRSLYWYSWYVSRSGFTIARTQVGTLESKLFQEQNAQNLLSQTEAGISQAKQQYQQATTSTDKQLAATNWQGGLSKLQQIPAATLAGRDAQKKLSPYQKEFQETVGLFAGNEVTRNLIGAAQQFAWQAAKDGQNPPHSAVKWRQITGLWEQAIARLKTIPPTDLGGYAEAQKLMAEYQANLSAINARLDAEQNSVVAFERAQAEINMFIKLASSSDRNGHLSRLQSIINQLEKVQPGTTPHLEAQQLLIMARNKLQQLK